MLRAFTLAIFTLGFFPGVLFASVQQLYCDTTPYSLGTNVICDSGWYLQPERNSNYIVVNVPDSSDVTNNGTSIKISNGQSYKTFTYTYVLNPVNDAVEATSDNNRILLTGIYILLFGVGMFVGQQR